MISIFSKLRLENLKVSLKEVFDRFPVGILAIVITFSLFFYQITVSEISDFLEDILFKSIISTIVVFFLSTAVALMGEALKISKNNNYTFQGLTIVFGALFYYFFGGQTLNFFASEEIVYIFLIFVGIISFLFFSPFVKNIIDKKFSQDTYYNYFLRISFIFLISFILGGALTILGFIGLGAIFTLFELDSLNESDYFGYFADFSLVLFTPLFFLSQLPKKVLSNREISIHSFFKFLIKFIGIPSIFIYFLILYAYTIKVLLNFDEWPHGEVSWMVIGFSIFGYLIYIFSYEFEKKNKAIKKFRKAFPYVVVPQVVMLFYAIYLRINQYDFTINRYFVVVFGLWLLVISFYLIISKKKILAFIPMILFDFIIVISIGPWSVYNFPESRQSGILNQNLIEAKILVDNKIVIANEFSDIEPEVSGKIYDIIGYLINNHGIKSLEKIFPEIISEIKKDYRLEWEKNNKLYDNSDYYGIPSWTLTEKLRNKLKVRAYYGGNISQKKYINCRLEYDLRNDMIEIKGYDYLTELSAVYDNSNVRGDLYSAGINTKDEKIIISKNGVLLEEFDVTNVFNDFYQENKGHIDRYGGLELKERLEIEKEGTKVDIKVVLSDFSILNPAYTGTDSYFNSNVSGKVMIRVK